VRLRVAWERGGVATRAMGRDKGNGSRQGQWVATRAMGRDKGRVATCKEALPMNPSSKIRSYKRKAKSHAWRAGTTRSCCQKI
jgi:hypothetical protein